MKKQKIVITGGLGYVGFELCKLYSGETRYKNIVVTDNKFLSESVTQLRKWGFDFVQTSILDKSKISQLVSDADIVFHFAGITDVPQTKDQSDPNQDKLVYDTSVQGTRNILNSIHDDCKFIFPSTHVVYEGFEDTVFDITEQIVPRPILSYSHCKVDNENDIITSKKKYIILRLASVYGYSGNTMRLNIMPNLFSKITSSSGTIKLFSGGVQYKSLVNVIDVARCFKFMAESAIFNEIFHLSNENVTVKEVADICKKYNPSVTLVETDDKIPNLGYTLSNKKLLGTGFKFLYSLESSIKEMIDMWSPKKQYNDLEFVINGQKEFVDHRGKISNYELTEPINLIGYIESKKGTLRANHYHPIQEQKCLLIKGKYISVIKDLGNPNSIIQTRIVNEGDIAVIQPNVAHTMIFLEDSVFLNLVRGEREHENYGVTHTISYKLVDEDLKNKILNYYSTKCRCCGSEKLEPVVSLGLSPLANNLLDNEDQPDDMYPLEMQRCVSCYNCQLSMVVPATKMFDNYLYVSSTSKSFRDHFENAANQYIKDFNLNEKSLVVDIGSNDGVSLVPLKNKGIKVVGVEPAKNIAKIANNNNIETINDYFTSDVVKTIENIHGKADLITASNVFAHADHLDHLLNNAMYLLKDDGTFIIEVQYLIDTVNDLTYDNIYHEHVNYWSVTSLHTFVKSLGYYISKVEHIDTHGGSIRVYISKQSNNTDGSLDYFLKCENEFGIHDPTVFRQFADRVYQTRVLFRKNIEKLKQQGYILAGYGSPAKATTFLNYTNTTHQDFKYTIEDNSLKHHKLIPGSRIPIVDKNTTFIDPPNVIIVLAWNFYDVIVKNNEDLLNKGTKFVNIKRLTTEEL